MKVEIRAATKDDAESIANLHTESWKSTYANVLTSDYLEKKVPLERKMVWIERLQAPKNNQYVFVAELNGKVLGFACVYLDENHKWGSYLDNLHVYKTYQSQGVGKSLILYVAHYCKQYAATNSLCLLVNQDNVKAQAFYYHLGAANKQSSIWSAPDGSEVPTYWFVWNTLSSLRLSEA